MPTQNNNDFPRNIRGRATRRDAAPGSTGGQSPAGAGRLLAGGFVAVPNGLFDYTPRIGSNGLLVYLGLAKYAWLGSGITSCYPSVPALARDVGLSECTIRRALRALVRERLISVSPNHDGSRRGNQYTLLPIGPAPTGVTGTGVSLEHPCHTDAEGCHTDRGTGVAQTGQGCHRDTRRILIEEYPKNHTHETPPPNPPRGAGGREGESSTPCRIDTDFKQFWDAYPEKIGEEDARREWRKLNPSPSQVEDILAAVERQKRFRRWRDGYIPSPAKWLAGKRWTDEDTKRAIPTHSGRRDPRDSRNFCKHVPRPAGETPGAPPQL
jgi:hypothetical protein